MRDRCTFTRKVETRMRMRLAFLPFPQTGFLENPALALLNINGCFSLVLHVGVERGVKRNLVGYYLHLCPPQYYQKYLYKEIVCNSLSLSRKLWASVLLTEVGTCVIVICAL